MERIADAFLWPTRDPNWIAKTLVTALILVIPIVGAINALGWMLASLHNLRKGDERLPPADLTHLGAGAPLFVVQLIYGLSIAAAALILYVPGILLATASGHGNANPLLLGLALVFYMLGLGVSTLGGLAVLFMTPAIVLATDAGGIGAGLNVGAVVKRTRFNLSNTLIAGLMLIAASFIGSLGAFACFVGVFVTGAYAYAMQAWIVRSFEIGSRPDQPPAA